MTGAAGVIDFLCKLVSATGASRRGLYGRYSMHSHACEVKAMTNSCTSDGIATVTFRAVD